MVRKLSNNMVIINSTKRVQSPTNNTCQQGSGRFVDMDVVFEGDEDITYNKNDNNGGNHE